ncbi:MAG: hypothetical protein RIS70_1053 [Planctomycetota bacterium]
MTTTWLVAKSSFEANNAHTKPTRFPDGSMTAAKSAAELKNLPIFVYGTLKRGEIREKRWPRRPLEILPAWTQGFLHDTGPYPAMVAGTDRVLGELWFVANDDLAETLRVLDRIECYGTGGVDLYVRVTVDCETLEGRQHLAYTYLYAEDISRHVRVRPSPDGYCRWSRSS